MIFSSPVPFDEASKLQSAKTVVPTTLTSAELRALGPDFFQRAQVSARVANAQYVDLIDSITAEQLAGELDTATARMKLGELSDLLGLGHDDQRRDLIVETNLATTRGFAQNVQANDPDTANEWPAQELYRAQERRQPRNWEGNLATKAEGDKGVPGAGRWMQAAQAVHDGVAARMLMEHGRMIALIDSGIWAYLGSAWPDSLGNDFAPFAWRSGERTRLISRNEAQELGAIQPDQKVAPRPVPDFNAKFQMNAELRSQRLQEELLQQFGDTITFDNGVLKLK